MIYSKSLDAKKNIEKPGFYMLQESRFGVFFISTEHNRVKPLPHTLL